MWIIAGVGFGVKGGVCLPYTVDDAVICFYVKGGVSGEREK